MAYTLNKSNGVTITVADNAVDKTYGVQLVGKNRSNYGVAINENFFHLMENFANSSQPTNPQAGQVWWDTQTQTLKVFDTSWVPISSVYVQSTASEPPAATGRLWWDTDNLELKVYTGSTWKSSVSGLSTREIPQHKITTDTVLALTDAGKHIYADTGTLTVTVPNNSDVAFAIGTTVTVVNNTSNNLAVTPGTSVNLRQSGGALGAVTLATHTVVTMLKVDTNTWYVK